MVINNFSPQEFLDSDPEDPIKDDLEIDCSALSKSFSTASKDAETAGNLKKSEIYKVLGWICDFHFKPQDKAEPYGPMFTSGEGRRSAIPSDLRGAVNDVLAQIAPSIKNSGLRARIADVVWLNDRKQVESGKLAVTSYIESIEKLLAGKAKLRFERDKAWDLQGVAMLQRAGVIAYAMGREKPEAELVREAIKKVWEAVKLSEETYAKHRVAELGLYYSVIDPQETGEFLEAEATKLKTSGDFASASDLFELAVNSFRYAKDKAASERCMMSSAECMIDWANASKDSAMSEAHWIQTAIDKLRTVSGTKIKREELQKRLLEAQARCHDEMGTFESDPIDLTDMVESLIEKVRGVPLHIALLKFSTVSRSPKVEELIDKAKEEGGNSIAAMFGASILDKDGKVITRTSGYDRQNPSEDSIRHLILQHEEIRRNIAVSGGIEPIRRFLYAQHPIEIKDLLPLMEMSPFIPYGRAYTFSMGFSRFFGGDYLSAIYILCPQLENSLRYILKQNGIDVSKIKSDMTQEDTTLSVILSDYREDLERIVGKDIAYEIENLFDIKGGPAIRHSLAHGLYDDGHFTGANVIYACWFIFRLCMLPLFNHVDEINERYEAMR